MGAAAPRTRSEGVLQRAQRKRARTVEQRDVVVTTFPALPAGTAIQLTAMSISAGPQLS